MRIISIIIFLFNLNIILIGQEDFTWFLKSDQACMKLFEDQIFLSKNQNPFTLESKYINYYYPENNPKRHFHFSPIGKLFIENCGQTDYSTYEEFGSFKYISEDTICISTHDLSFGKVKLVDKITTNHNLENEFEIKIHAKESKEILFNFSIVSNRWPKNLRKKQFEILDVEDINQKLGKKVYIKEIHAEIKDSDEKLVLPINQYLKIEPKILSIFLKDESHIIVEEGEKIFLYSWNYQKQCYSNKTLMKTN